MTSAAVICELGALSLTFPPSFLGPGLWESEGGACLEAGSRTRGEGPELGERGRKGDPIPAAMWSPPVGGNAVTTMRSELSCNRRGGVGTRRGGLAFSADFEHPKQLSDRDDRVAALERPY